MGIERGVITSLPRLEPQFEGDDFSPMQFMQTAESRLSSWFRMVLDESGRIELMYLRGAHHFDLLAELATEPPPFSWRVRSLDDLSRFEVGTALEIGSRTTADCLDLLIGGLGGLGALAPVEKLVLYSYGLRFDQVEELFELPNLTEVTVTENERYREASRGIGELCQSLKRRRPDVKVIFDKTPLDTDI